MKHTYKLYIMAAAAAALAAGCQKFDDSDILSRLDSQDNALVLQEKAIASLEGRVKEINTTITSLSNVLSGYASGLCAVSWLPIDGDKGYTLTLSDGTALTLYNGRDGADGKAPFIGPDGNWWIGDRNTGVAARGSDGGDGQNGGVPVIGDNGNWWINGKDTGVSAEGADGKDGKILGIAIGMEEIEGVLCWTVEGQPILTPEGKTVPVVGARGKDATGTTDAKGAPGATPRLKVIDGWICVSTDGLSWTRLSPSRGAKGEKGDTGAAGADGVTLVTRVTPSEDGKKITLTLADGKDYTLLLGKSSVIEYSKDRETMRLSFLDTTLTFRKVHACTFTMGANKQRRSWTGEGGKTMYGDPKHNVTLTRDYWVMQGGHVNARLFEMAGFTNYKKEDADEYRDYMEGRFYDRYFHKKYCGLTLDEAIELDSQGAYPDKNWVENTWNWQMTRAYSSIRHLQVTTIYFDNMLAGFEEASGLPLRVMTTAETENAMRTGILNHDCISNDWTLGVWSGKAIGEAKDETDPTGPTAHFTDMPFKVVKVLETYNGSDYTGNIHGYTDNLYANSGWIVLSIYDKDLN